MQTLQARSSWAGPRPAAPQATPAHARPATRCVKAASGQGSDQAEALSQRRQILALPALLLPVFWGGAAQAEEGASPAAAASREAYVDAQDKFSIVVPSGWEQGSGDMSGPQDRFSNAAGMRRVVAWYPTEQVHDVTVAVTMQPIGADFTGLGSFGRVEDFGAGLVNSMDRSFLLRAPAFTRARNTEPIVIAKLLEAKEKDSMYYVSYSLSRLAADGSEDERRTVYSVVAMGNNGSQNRLFSVNASSKEPGLAAYGAELQAAVASFRPPPPRV